MFVSRSKDQDCKDRAKFLPCPPKASNNLVVLQQLDPEIDKFIHTYF